MWISSLKTCDIVIYQKYIIGHSVDQNILFMFIWTLSTVSIHSFQTLEFPKYWKYWGSFIHNTSISTTTGLILMRWLLETPKDRLVSRQPTVNRGFRFQSHPLSWPPAPLPFLVLRGWDWRCPPSNQVGSPDNPRPASLRCPEVTSLP